jgi:hypothetical protein
MDRTIVEKLIRLKLNHRRLPARDAVGFRETVGDGGLCDACDQRIERNDRAVIVMVSLEWSSVRFHVDCYEVWKAERVALSENDGEGHQSTTT